ncbi:hypothetical protein BKA70DRAFT_1310204 [Coprinopsis sp. MPI-PUGE-AT-0042]|nr:hypothetical protein BKA70DRAFT_1310204 [Coprinopsis sp. MPI-PUGE-AT-0042]
MPPLALSTYSSSSQPFTTLIPVSDRIFSISSKLFSSQDDKKLNFQVPLKKADEGLRKKRLWQAHCHQRKCRCTGSPVHSGPTDQDVMQPAKQALRPRGCDTLVRVASPRLNQKSCAPLLLRVAELNQSDPH